VARFTIKFLVPVISLAIFYANRAIERFEVARNSIQKFIPLMTAFAKQRQRDSGNNGAVGQWDSIDKVTRFRIPVHLAAENPQINQSQERKHA